MLAKAQRLQVGEFLSRRGQVFRLEYAIFKVFPTTIGYSRFGVVTPKKSFATAAERNRLKRAFFGAARMIYSKIVPCDIVLTLLPSVSGSSSVELRDRLARDLIRYLPHI